MRRVEIKVVKNNPKEGLRVDAIPFYIGKSFSWLTVLEYLGHDRYSQRVMECRCKCGKKVRVLLYQLRRNMRRSCGCWTEQKKSLPLLERKKIVKEMNAVTQKTLEETDKVNSPIPAVPLADSYYPLEVKAKRRPAQWLLDYWLDKYGGNLYKTLRVKQATVWSWRQVRKAPEKRLCKTCEKEKLVYYFVINKRSSIPKCRDICEECKNGKSSRKSTGTGISRFSANERDTIKEVAKAASS